MSFEKVDVRRSNKASLYYKLTLETSTQVSEIELYVQLKFFYKKASCCLMDRQADAY